MSRLMRTSEIHKRPVVTLDGEDVAQVKDVVYESDGGAVAGFTLAGRGLFAGPMKEVLAWSDVAGLGNDAVMVDSRDRLRMPADSDAAWAGGTSGGGDVLRSEVLTDSGVALGTVVDVIIEVDPGSAHCDVIGYEIEPSAAMGSNHKRLLIPLPDTLAASGGHLMVPASAQDFVREDLAGFGAAVDDFRAQLGGTR